MRVLSNVFAAAALLLPACSSTSLNEPGTESQGTGQPASGGSSAAPAADSEYYLEDYPAGPYGTSLGSTLENLAFLGWLEPAVVEYDLEQLKTVRLSRFYNPDGRSDLKLIWINASAVWCSVCKAEMKDIRNQDVNARFRAKGVQLIGTLFEDNATAPARPLDLQRWGQVEEHSIEFPLLLDPGFKLGAFFTSDATPLNLLVDAATMRIIDATMGYSSDYWQQVDQLLQK